jgi:hypothetical protein
MGLLTRATLRRTVLFVGLLALGESARVSAQGGTGSLEYQVKAAYLLNFTRYVEWPARASPDTPLELCILGEDPFGEVLDQAIQGRRSQGRPVTVRRVESDERVFGCHLVFVTDESWNRRRTLVASLTSRGVLTVGDSDQFGRSGGIIGFVISNETVRFVINLKAMERSGLRISSRMLSLAMQLHQTEGTPF